MSEPLYSLLLCSQKEKEMGFGRLWDYPVLNRTSTIISSSLADALHLSVGDTLHISVNLSRFFDISSDLIFEQLVFTNRVSPIDCGTD